jgi:phenylacetate-CoA ligase
MLNGRRDSMAVLDFLEGVHEARTVLNAEPKKVEDIARKRLRNILNEAYRKVPYYSKIFKSRGITPDNIEGVDDLCKLPILTRRDVRENQVQMLNGDFRPDQCIRRTTSGSTGEPVACLFDVKDWYHIEGIALRGQFRGGLKILDKVAVVAVPESLARNSLYRILAQVGRLKYTSVFDDLKGTLSSLRAFSPDILKTYPSLLRSAAETGEGFHCPLIFTMSELLEGGLRKIVEDDFGTRIIDLYGAVEFTSIAWECNLSSLYHIDADAVTVEAVKLDSDYPASPGERARIIVTSLLNRAMPLIRYDLGDIAVLADDECGCGVKLPVVRKIEGRQVDCIRLPSGRLISPYVLTDWIDHEIFGIAHYQIIQEDTDRITAKIVPRPGFEENRLAAWANRFSEIVGEHVVVELQIVSSISVEKTGKYKYVVSKVN